MKPWKLNPAKCGHKVLEFGCRGCFEYSREYAAWNFVKSHARVICRECREPLEADGYFIDNGVIKVTLMCRSAALMQAIEDHGEDAESHDQVLEVA